MSADGLTIAAATEQDAADIVRFWAEAGAEPTATSDVAGVTALIEHDPGALLVARDGPALVGTVVAAFDGWRGAFYRLVVAPTHRRRGLGRRLVEAGEQRLAALGVRRVAAIIVADNERARRFWDAVGYPVDPSVVRAVRNVLG